MTYDEAITACRKSLEYGRGPDEVEEILSALQPEPVSEEIETLRDDLETAWGIIANAGGGNWELETADWQTAAADFRTRWHATLERYGGYQNFRRTSDREGWVVELEAGCWLTEWSCIDVWNHRKDKATSIERERELMQERVAAERRAESAEARVKELEGERDAMQRRAEAAESDWQSAEAKVVELKARLRKTAQTIIAVVGADSPENADDAAERIVAKVTSLTAQVERLEVELANDKIDRPEWRKELEIAEAELLPLRELAEAVKVFRPKYNTVVLGRFRGERCEGDDEECGQAATKLFAALARAEAP